MVWSARSYYCDVVCNALTRVVSSANFTVELAAGDTPRAYDALGCQRWLSYGEGWSNTSKPSQPFLELMFEIMQFDTSSIS